MTDVLKFSKKLFTFSVVVVTIAWSMGLAAMVPTAVYAEEECPELDAGDMYKVAGQSAVYLLNADLESKYFVSDEQFWDWNLSFSDVVTIPNVCFDLYDQADPPGINYRPGSLLVKRTESPSVYAILPGNLLKKVESPSVLEALYGENWGSLLRDVPSYYWSNYVKSDDVISEAIPHDGQNIMKTGETTVYTVKDGMLYEVTGLETAALTEDELMDVREVSAEVFATLEVADSTVTKASIFEDPGQDDNMTTTPAEEEEGELTVSLSANTPDASNVVINVDNVVFSKFIVKAEGSDATVNSVKIVRKGLGATGDFTSVTLYDGDTKLGTSRTSWNSNGYIVYNIPSGWAIPAGESKELTLVAKLDTASTYNALGISEINGEEITSVYGNEMSGVSTTVGQVTITNMGNAATKKIGNNDVELASFKLALNSVEDGAFSAITLKNKAATSNAADADVANVSLYKGSELLAGPVSMSNDYITFTLDEPVSIAKSQNEIFSVKGDIVNGDGNTIEYVLKDTTDLTVKGDTYGTNLSVVNTNYNAATEGAIITIDGAELNVSYTGSNLDTIDNVTDVNFGTLTLSAGSTAIKITEMVLGIDETNGDGVATNNKDVDEFELVESDGGAYSGTMTGGGDTDADSEIWTFSDEIYLDANETKTFTLQGDLPNGIGSGDSYKVTSTINTTNLTAETVSQGDTVDNFSIGSFTGKIITVKSPTLKVSGINMNNGTAVVNDTDVILFKGTLEAQADDIHITYANFDANTTFATANWTQLGFYTVADDDSYNQEQLITNSSMTSGTLSFDALDLTVTNGSANKVTFVVKGTVASSVNTNNVAKLKLDYFTAKATSDNSDASVTSGSDDLSTSAGDYLTTGGRQVTLNDKGKLYMQMEYQDSGYDKDRVLLAGSSDWIGKLKMKAIDEDIKVKDLKLTNTVTSTADDDLASVCLYTAAEATTDNLISCQTVDSSGVVFYDDIDEVVPQGTNYWYIYVNSNPMSDQADGTADSKQEFAFGITTSTSGSLVAEGVRSGYTLTYAGNDGTTPSAGEYAFDYDNDDSYNEAVDGHTANTKSFYIAGSRISNVDLVDSYGGETVDTSIAGTGEYTLAILAITNEDNSNTDANGSALKLTLNNILLNVDKFASTTLSGATIKRIGGAVAAQSLTISGCDGSTETSGDWTISSVTTTLGVDAKIEAGDTAYYVIKGTIDGLNNTTGVVDWIRVSLDDIKGTAGGADSDNNIDWFDGYASTSVLGNDFDYLLLDTTSKTGTKVAESL